MAEQEKINLTAVCRQLGYSKQGYYKSISLKKRKAVDRKTIKERVMGIRHLMPRLGTRKLYYLLKEAFRRDSIPIGRDRLFELLREEGLLIVKKKKYTKTTDSKHWMRRYPNLIKGIKLKRPEQLWVADITYIQVGQGYRYLHLVTDAYSKQIMGYKVSENLAAMSTLEALKMAIRNRKYPGKLIHHSDRGLQYCSTLYVKTLQRKKISISMTEDGSPYDNAIAERINGILKDEFGLDDTFESTEQLELQVGHSVTLYNERRPHESNHMLTPFEMHQQNKLKPKAWHKKPTRTLEGTCEFLAMRHY